LFFFAPDLITNSKTMGKEKFQISAIQSGQKAEIRIIGIIGWDTDSESFRKQVDALINAGINDAHIYIQSPGGNCFDANEIVNIISKFKGNITGEGGSLVASAATYIAIHCKEFSMPENGMFMIHKPCGCAAGNATEIESYLKLLKALESQYYDSYKAVAKDLAAFKQKWDTNADWWLTSKEAKENGFVTSVTQKVKIDRETVAQIKACGCPIEIEINQKNNENQKEMDLKKTALMLGLSETATEEEVNAKLLENAKAATDFKAMQKANQEKEKTEMAEKIKATLDKAILEKRIKADCRDQWQSMLEANFEKASKALNDIAPIEKLSSQIIVSKEGKKTYKGKTFEQLQDEDPEALALLEEEDPEAFKELFNENYKERRNK
jgi:ATP-dependent protease ClpP protease subunit